MYAYNTPLYAHTTFYTHTKHLVRIHKLSVHVQHIFNGYTDFVHMQYGCVRVLVQNTFLHVKKGFVREKDCLYKTHVKTLVCLEQISHHSYTTTSDIH